MAPRKIALVTPFFCNKMHAMGEGGQLFGLFKCTYFIINIPLAKYTSNGNFDTSI